MALNWYQIVFLTFGQLGIKVASKQAKLFLTKGATEAWEEKTLGTQHHLSYRVE